MPLDDDENPAWSARWPLLAGIVALVMLIGGVGYWSLSTQLAGAVVTSGTVQVDSNRQVIQHPDGGVVSEILVRGLLMSEFFQQLVMFLLHLIQ